MLNGAGLMSASAVKRSLCIGQLRGFGVSGVVVGKRETMKQMSQFVTENSITIKSKRIAENPLMGNGMDHWSCSLAIPQDGSSRKKRMTVKFSQGYAFKGADPTAQDVLGSLASDAATIENTQTFNDWCSELGYDCDSRKAESIWRACRKLAVKLEEFLGSDLYREILWDIEPE